MPGPQHRSSTPHSLQDGDERRVLRRLRQQELRIRRCLRDDDDADGAMAAVAVAPSSAVSVPSAASAIVGEYFTDDDPTNERTCDAYLHTPPRRLSVATLPLRRLRAFARSRDAWPRL